MDLEMQAEIPVELCDLFSKQAEARNCTVEDIVLETIRKFLRKEGKRSGRFATKFCFPQFRYGEILLRKTTKLNKEEQNCPQEK